MTRVALLASLVAVALASAVLYRHQRRDGIGGEISPAKTLWLGWVVYLWFFVTPLVAFAPATELSLTRVLGLFFVNMVLRAFVELFMLLVTKNWRPAYGVVHNLFSLALLFGAVVATSWSSGHTAWLIEGGSTGYLWLLLVLTGSLAVETYYALAFHHLVGNKTMGEQGVWFADNRNPKFLRINRITARNNWVLFTGLGVALTWLWEVL